MNLINIVKNAPEGATHYKIFPRVGDLVEYYKIIKGQSMFSSNRDKRWKSGFGPNGCSNSTPLPKLKAEYRKVEDSIWDLRPDFEARDLYYKLSDDEYEPIINIPTLVLALGLGLCFYRSEKIIDEREEFKKRLDSARQEWTESNPDSMDDFLFDRGCRFID